MKPLIKTIVFDLDGTLIDTEPSAAQAILNIFAKWNIQIDPQDAQHIVGKTWESAFAFLFSKYQIPVPKTEASQIIVREYRDILDRELPLVPGSVDAVRSLATRFPLGLVSGSHREEIFWALGKLGILELFQVVLGAEDYPRSKPAPDGYSKALELLHQKPENGLVFEDSNPGVSSALAAGLWVIAITGTNHFGQNLSHAHRQIPDLKQVTPEWIQKLSSSQ